MHGHGRPRDRPAAAHFQILARRQFDLRRALQELLLHALVVFLPTVIRKGRHIIKYKSIFLAVELRRSIRISRTPGGAITVDKLAERGLVRGLLLRPGADKSQQCTEYRQRHIQHPAPSLGMIAGSSAHRSGHSVSPGNPRTRVCRWRSQGVPHTLLRICPFCKRSYSNNSNRPNALILGRYCPSPTHHSPVNPGVWPNLGCTPPEGSLFLRWGKEWPLGRLTWWRGKHLHRA